MNDKNYSLPRRINIILTIALAVGGVISLLFSAIDFSELTNHAKETTSHTAAYVLLDNITEGSHVVN